MQQAIPFSNGRTWMPLPSPAALLAGRTFPPPQQQQSQQPQAGPTAAAAGVPSPTSTDALRRLVAENPVLVLGRRGCCMCHVIRRLLLGLGVNPAVCELDDARADEAAAQLARELPPGAPENGDNSTSRTTQLPAVFIGGSHVGGLDRLMAKHISGELVPMLKDAGALWL